MKKPVTLADVARAAGVAVGTASRVINNFGNVNAEAQQSVHEAVARLNYKRLRQRRRSRPDRQKEPGRSCNIGLILLGMDETLVHVPVLAELLHGVESAIGEKNGNLFLANLPNADRLPAFLSSGTVDGIIVKTSQYKTLPDAESSQLMRSMLRLPLVWLWDRPAGARGDLCSFNHETAAMLAAQHLAHCGHRRVAFLNPKKGKTSLEHMKKEFQFACARYDLKLTFIESGSSQVATKPEPALSGPAEVLPLVQQWKDTPAAERPTGIFIPADNFSVHVNAVMEQLGVQVGRDVSLVSCNNEKSLIDVIRPRLTTVDVSAAHIGRRAVEQLLWRIHHPHAGGYQTILFEPSLVEGDSVAMLGDPAKGGDAAAVGGAG